MENKVAFVIVSLATIVCLTSTDQSSTQDACLNSIFGAEYSGTESISSSGKPCMRWDIVLPSSTTNWTAHENHCRYFTGPQFGTTGNGARTQPWCYTDGNGGWESCHIPRCDLPAYETCYSSPTAITNTNFTECNCSVSLSLKATPAVQLIRTVFLYPAKSDSCSREVVLYLDDKPLDLTCDDGQSIDLSMPMGANTSYSIGLGLRVDKENLTTVGLHQISYAAMPFVNLASCDVIRPVHHVIRPSGTASNVEIRTLGTNGSTTPFHDHEGGHNVHRSNHTLKGLIIGLVVSAVVAVGVISVITYIWMIDKRHMRSELLREYLGDDQLSSDEEKTYFSEPKAYINAIAIESERDEQPRPQTLDQLDPVALARSNKELKPNGCNCVSVDVPDKKDFQNGHVTNIETAIVPISELENFDDLSDVIANPMAEDAVIRNCDTERPVDQENSV